MEPQKPNLSSKRQGTINTRILNTMAELPKHTQEQTAQGLHSGPFYGKFPDILFDCNCYTKNQISHDT